MKNIFKKIFCGVVLAGIGLFLFSACNVKSESQIKDYAQKNFGSCTLISTQTDDKGSRKCIFRDNEYGFEYYVQSSMHDINIDGSKFGSTESTDSNFSSQYKNILQSTRKSDFQKIEQDFNVTIGNGDTVNFMTINCNDVKSDFLEASEKLADVIISFDSRKYYKESSLGVYDSENNRLGKYQIHDKKWIPSDDEYDYIYINEAKQINRKAEFVRKEKMLFKDTGLDPSQVAVFLGNPEYTYETPVQYYYFTADGKEFFIADFITDYDASLIRHYSNYDEIFN